MVRGPVEGNAIALRGHPEDYGAWAARTGAWSFDELPRGYPAVADHNAPGTQGVGPVPVNRVDGIRQS